MTMQNLDQQTTVKGLRELVSAFRQARGWNVTDNVKNLTMALTVEAAELMEIFSWCTTEGAAKQGQEKFEHVHEEISDVLIYLLSIADLLEVDLCSAVKDKLAKNAKKYPILSSIQKVER